jgi:hypothetical protein
MSESELSGEHALWSGLVQQRVVRFHDFFHEIRVLGNVRRRLDEFEAYGMAALLAIRKDRVPGEKHGRPRLVGVANFVNARLFHQLSGNDRAIGLVKLDVLYISQSHEKARNLIRFLSCLLKVPLLWHEWDCNTES